MSTEQPKQQFSEIRLVAEVRGLAREILSRDRAYPIIGLTAYPGEDGPPLSIERIRGIVGPNTPIYFIASHDLVMLLGHFLPRCLGINRGAARLWWPGVDKDSKPQDHPRFYDVRCGCEEEIYAWLEGEFRPPLRPYLEPFASRRRDILPTGQRLAGRRAGLALIISMKVLSYFSDGRPMGHGEVARRANISRSLAARCLTELTALGYLTETRERNYRLAGALQRLRITPT